MLNQKGESRGPETAGATAARLLQILRRSVDRITDQTVRAEVLDWIARWAPADQGVLSEKVARRAISEALRLSVHGRIQEALAEGHVPHPTYDYLESFDENLSGPRDAMPSSWEVPNLPLWSVLGFNVGFPIGVPASVLTANAKWIEYYARRGFNVLTYKTVRSAEFKAHPSPNWVFLEDAGEPFAVGRLPKEVRGSLDTWPSDPGAFSMANSFGVPSSEPAVWEEDIARALASLKRHQLLIVSVMGFWERYEGDDLVEDFVRVAVQAEAAGARAIELNLSCPNTVDPSVHHMRPPLCESPAVVREIVLRVRDKLAHSETRLIVKLSYMTRHALEEVIEPLDGSIAGVAGINALQMRATNPDGSPVFVGTADDPAEPRWEAGISGVAVRNYALDFVRSVVDISKYMTDVDVIAMGGVVGPDDVLAFLEVGAAVVQTATAAFFNPSLPAEVSQMLLEHATIEGVSSGNLPGGHRDRVLEELRRARGAVSDLQIAAGTALTPAAVEEILRQLIDDGLVGEVSRAGRELFVLQESRVD